MKFFVTGVGGQLGHDVMNELLKRGHEGVGSDIQEYYSGVADGSAVTKAPYVALDITDKDAVEKVITEVNPDAVIHCAAWTAVDMAEDDDKVEKVRAINAGGTQNIADVCKKLDCKMTYISTGFSGFRSVHTIRNEMCLPTIGIFEVILNTFTQNDDFICILYCILFTLPDEFRTKS